ncbi:hypothetical protein DEO72_LG6g1006 [Vigna unguiculata]|uniref:Uncharacterized protein n=1 Tax=Vigna unguiculata TaxID=3917 RepID=A0A4D6M911_VIGUN|nr:hypothetical protein DEO72_LG6g1006 [Vigna unguiculata]
MNVKGINLSHLEMRVTSGFRSLLTYGKKEGDKKWVLLLSRFTRVAIRSTNPRNCLIALKTCQAMHEREAHFWVFEMNRLEAGVFSPGDANPCYVAANFYGFLDGWIFKYDVPPGGKNASLGDRFGNNDIVVLWLLVGVFWVQWHLAAQRGCQAIGIPGKSLERVAPSVPGDNVEGSVLFWIAFYMSVMWGLDQEMLEYVMSGEVHRVGLREGRFVEAGPRAGRFVEACTSWVHGQLGIEGKYMAFLELWLRMTSLELWLGMADGHEQSLSCGLDWRVLSV